MSGRPIARAVFGFLGLSAALLVVALARSRGLLTPEQASRASGVLVGLVAMLGGNDVPKLRPLAALDRDGARAARIERAIGQLLVVAGFASLVWFVVAPIAQARAASGAFGLACLGIAALRAWLETPGVAAADGSAAAGPRPALAAWLLFAIVYVFATACLASLAIADARMRAWLAWGPVAFSIAWAVLQVRLAWAASRRRGQPR